MIVAQCTLQIKFVEAHKKDAKTRSCSTRNSSYFFDELKMGESLRLTFEVNLWKVNEIQKCILLVEYFSVSWGWMLREMALGSSIGILEMEQSTLMSMVLRTISKTSKIGASSLSEMGVFIESQRFLLSRRESEASFRFWSTVAIFPEFCVSAAIPMHFLIEIPPNVCFIRRSKN